MPPIEDMDRPHTAVLWAAGVTDDFGNPSRGEPTELTPADGTGVFWTMKRTQTVNAKGEPVALDATAVMDRAPVIGSWMWKGALADWNDEGVDEVMQVVWVSENTDIKDRWARYTVGLTRFGDDLPAPPPP